MSWRNGCGVLVGESVKNITPWIYHHKPLRPFLFILYFHNLL